MIDHEFGSWPSRRARSSAGEVALIQDDRTRTFEELEDRSSRFAAGLRDRGVFAGDRVAFLGPNCIEMVEWMFAVARVGAVAVPLNTQLAPAELAAILADCRPKVLAVTHHFRDVVESGSVPLADITTVLLPDPVDTDDPLGAVSEVGSSVSVVRSASTTCSRFSTPLERAGAPKESC